MKDLTKANKEFFDRLSRYYDRGIFKVWLTGSLKRTLRQIRIEQNSKVLDAGCGTGNLLLLLSSRKDLHLYGIDTSPKMLARARKKLSQKVKLELQPVEAVRAKNKFDYIFSAHAFHHYSGHHQAMQNFYRALKKNGKLVVVDMNFGLFNKIIHLIEPGNSRMFSPVDFINIFKQHKFKDIKQAGMGLFDVLTMGKK